MDKEKAKQKWVEFYKLNVEAEDNLIDPCATEDWRSMALGFFSALGFDAETCHELVEQVPL